jgi:hypothetical protein
MKKSLIILPLLAAAAAGGHYAVWQTQTAKFTKALTERIEKINADTEAGATITYDAKETSGYPAKSVISLINPTIKAKEGDTSITIEGALRFSSPLLGDTLEMTIDGPLHATAEDEHYIITSAEPTHCSIKAVGSIIDYMIGKHTLPKAPTAEDVAENFRHFSCNAEDVTVADKENAPIATAKKYHISANANPTTGKEKMFNFALQVKDMEVLQETAFKHSLASDPNLSFLEDISWIKYKDLGKQNITVTGGFVGDIDSDNNFQFDLQEVSVSNALYRMEFPISVHNQETLTIKHEGTFAAEEQFDSLNIEGAKSMITAIKEGDTDATLGTPLTEKIKDGSISEELIINAVPQLHPYGDIKTFANVNGKLMAQEGKIEKVGFSTALFSLIATGDISSTALDVTVECGKCDVLLTRLSDYANAVTALLHASEEVSAPVAFAPEAVKALSAITRDYDSNKEDGDTITWKIAKNTQGQITLSGQAVDALFMRVMMEVAPHMPVLQGE